MSDKPKQIRDVGYKPFVPNSVITNTKYNSSIDNIYMDIMYNVDGIISTEIGNQDVFQSDHVLCGIAFDEKKMRDHKS